MTGYSSNLTSALFAEYIWLNDRLVAAIADGIVFYARTDHIGRPMFSTVADGIVIGTGSWEPFGALHASTGPALNLRFPGQWFGGESGLNQNWMRDYDPTQGEAQVYRRTSGGINFTKRFV